MKQEEMAQKKELTIGEIGCWFSFSEDWIGNGGDCASRSTCGRIGDGEGFICTGVAPSRP